MLCSCLLIHIQIIHSLSIKLSNGDIISPIMFLGEIRRPVVTVIFDRWVICFSCSSVDVIPLQFECTYSVCKAFLCDVTVDEIFNICPS